MKCYLSITVFWRKKWSSKSVTTLMTMSFIQYPLMINLDKIK